MNKNHLHVQEFSLVGQWKHTVVVQMAAEELVQVDISIYEIRS